MSRRRTWPDLPLVEVVWIDAVIDPEKSGDLTDPSTAARFGGLALCSDVGYLIAQDRREIKLAVSVCRDDNTYRHSNTIPRGWVKSVTYLTRPPEPDKENS